MSESKKALATFEVNGEPHEVAFAPHKTLLEVLREEMNLTGTKHGCELGECGTCTVQVDGVPILSCLSLAVDAVGNDFETWTGTCGKDGQGVPVSAGQPTLRVAELTVGGTAA